MTPQQSYEEAKLWKHHNNAERHVILLKRITREKWIEIYGGEEFQKWVGVENWRVLVNDMAKIMAGEK